jgi:hypothetical protein
MWVGAFVIEPLSGASNGVSPNSLQLAKSGNEPVNSIASIDIILALGFEFFTFPEKRQLLLLLYSC